MLKNGSCSYQTKIIKMMTKIGICCFVPRIGTGVCMCACTCGVHVCARRKGERQRETHTHSERICALFGKELDDKDEARLRK